MKKILLTSVLAVGLLGIGITAKAANPMNKKEASPTLKERLTKAIKGRATVKRCVNGFQAAVLSG
ncbi:MAG: hypothetical protein LV473_19985 [Nitrospira sp.]|nr:hypothetical protein [Nitrospira sp.]